MAGIGMPGGQLQPVQGALARQRLALVALPQPSLTGRILLAHQHRQQVVQPELVMVVEVFMAQRKRQYPLRYQRLYRVLNQLRIPVVDKLLRQSLEDTRLALYLPQQQSAAVGTDLPTVETTHYFPPS